MIITKDAWIRFIYTVTISTIIYLTSTLVFAKENVLIFQLFISILVGIVIWFLSEMLFALAQQFWPQRNLPSYVVLILIISIGTCLGTYILGVRSVRLIIIICLFAEIFGILIVFLYQKHYKRVLNEKLKAFKDKEN